MRGLLPPYMGSDATTPARSPYLVSSLEFTNRFATTTDRCAILRGLLRYRELLGTLGYSDGFQLLDGSFVENIEHLEKRSPGDVDVFSFLGLPTVGAAGGQLDGLGQSNWNDEVIDRNKNKARFLVDSYAVLVPELGFHDLFNTINYWTSLFAHRRGTAAWKGFVTMPLDPTQDQKAAIELDAREASYA